MQYRVPVQLELSRVRENVRIYLGTPGTVLRVLMITETSLRHRLLLAAFVLLDRVTTRQTEVLLVFPYYKAHVGRVVRAFVVLGLARREVVVLVDVLVVFPFFFDRHRLLVLFTQPAVLFIRLQ